MFTTVSGRVDAALEEVAEPTRRQRHHSGRLDEHLGVDRRLVLEHVEAGAPPIWPATTSRASSVSSITSPRAVLM